MTDQLCAGEVGYPPRLHQEHWATHKVGDTVTPRLHRPCAEARARLHGR